MNLLRQGNTSYQKLIVRVDDIGEFRQNDLFAIERLESIGLRYILGVIPRRLDRRVSAVLKTLKRACIYQHGLNHVNRDIGPHKNEFPDTITTEIINEEIARGRKILQQEICKDIDGYIPPWNTISDKTLRVLERQAFKYISVKTRNQPVVTSLTPFHSTLDVMEQYRPPRCQSLAYIDRALLASVSRGERTIVTLHPEVIDPNTLSDILNLIHVHYAADALNHPDRA